MSDEELDPEVIADLQLRASSESDRTRTRRANYDWSPPAIVAYWRCRSGDSCRGIVDGQIQLVGVTEEAIHALAVANNELRSKTEPEIRTGAIVFCEPCKAEGMRMRQIALRDRTNRMADKIRRLKELPGGDEEREIVEQLRKWNHPDIDGLLQWIRAKREQSGAKKPRRGI